MILSLNGNEPVIPASCFVAPSADIIGEVSLGEDSSIWFGVVLRGDVHHIRIGCRSNIQDGAVLHGMKNQYPVVIGDDVTVGHNVTLHGCEIGNLCLIGMGSVILNNVRVGECSIVGAGALVPENTEIPPRSLYVGHPARFRRQLTEEDLDSIRGYAERYVGYKNDYLAEAGALSRANARGGAR